MDFHGFSSGNANGHPCHPSILRSALMGSGPHDLFSKSSGMQCAKLNPNNLVHPSKSLKRTKKFCICRVSSVWCTRSCCAPSNGQGSPFLDLEPSAVSRRSVVVVSWVLNPVWGSTSRPTPAADCAQVSWTRLCRLFESIRFHLIQCSASILKSISPLGIPK